MFKKFIAVILIAISMNAVAQPTQAEICNRLTQFMGVIVEARDKGMEVQEVVKLINAQPGMEAKFKKTLVDTTVTVYQSPLNKNQVQSGFLASCMK